MMRIKIATWNINSVRLRIGLVEKFIADYAPDVLCLQEIKVPNAEFPLKAFNALGFTHHAICGQKGYHGVATLSRLPMEDQTRDIFGGIEDQARHIAVTLPGQIRLHNFYVPAGGDEPDVATNDKFAHKLAYLTDMAKHFGQSGRPKREILVGDLNVAPLEHDVWSHKQLSSVVSHTPIEIAHMEALRRSRDWIDTARHFTPEPEKLYTWWSYRAADWAKADKGRRLDHIWITPALKPALKAVEIVRTARGWQQPSDHVPSIVELEVKG
jgi:exodeoxyribonuclease-3